MPLMLDIANPSPAIGWRNQECDSVFDRPLWIWYMPWLLFITRQFPAMCALTSGRPFYSLGYWLIIEFTPKSDSQVQRLFNSRLDIFYTIQRMTLNRYLKSALLFTKKDRFVILNDIYT